MEIKIKIEPKDTPEGVVGVLEGILREVDIYGRGNFNKIGTMNWKCVKDTEINVCQDIEEVTDKILEPYEPGESNPINIVLTTDFELGTVKARYRG